MAHVDKHGPDHGTPVGALVPQPHGGALRNGGTNRGGYGRTPDRIRKAAQKALRGRLHLLGHFADGVAVAMGEDGTHGWQEVKPGERIRALEVLHKIGSGEQCSVHEVRARLTAQLKVMRQELDAATFTRLAAALEDVWR